MALTDCDQIDTTIGADGVIILVPDSYNAGVGAHMVVYHHGAGDDGSGMLIAATEPTVQGGINAGYIWCATEAAGDNWGNNAGLSAYAALDTYMRSTYNILKTVIYSGSMGGLTGLLCIANDTYDDLAGWCGVMPVCDLDNMHGGSLSGSIDTAYGGNYAVNSVGHNPMTLSTAVWPIMPYRFYASPSDTVVTKTANSDAFSVRIHAGKPEVAVLPATGEHGDVSHFQAADALDFFARCLVDRTVGIRSI